MNTLLLVSFEIKHKYISECQVYELTDRREYTKIIFSLLTPGDAFVFLNVNVDVLKFF